jgi:hypothetical protein
MNEQKVKKARPIRTSFVAGLLVGVIATVLVPKLVGPRLPRAISGHRELLDGVVTAKRMEPNRLLLTLPTAEGTILATFTEEVAEIDLLVQEGDSVTIEMQEYAPFANNPTIARVKKPTSPESMASRADSIPPAARAPAEFRQPDTASARSDTSGT